MTISNESLLNSLQLIYGALPYGVSLFQQDAQGQWQIAWANEPAKMFFEQHELLQEMPFKLELFSAVKRHEPTYVRFEQMKMSLIPLHDVSDLTSLLLHVQPLEDDSRLNSLFPEVADSSESHDDWNIAALDSLTDNQSLEPCQQQTPSIDSSSQSKVPAISEGNNSGAEIYSADFFRRFYQSAVQAADLACFVCYADSKKFLWDAQAIHVLGLPKSLLSKRAEALYETSFDLLLSFVHESEKSVVYEAFLELWEHGWPLELELRLRAKDHSYQWFYLKVERQNPFYVGSFSNINEQKRIKRQLYAREKLIEQLIDGLPIGIAVKDAQACYRFVNRQVEKDFALSRAEIIGRTDYEIFKRPNALQRLLSAQKPVFIGQLEVEEKSVAVSDKVQWFMVGSLSLQVENMEGRIEIWSMGFYFDITQRKLIEEQLRIANQKALMAAKAKSDFLSIMSHEIRTPLNSVIGNASLLEDLELDDEVAEHVKMIHRSGEHLLHLINDILDFNKLEAGKVDLMQEPIDLQDQIQSCVHMSEGAAKQKGVALRLQFNPKIAKWVRGDAGRLRQIFLNLIGNAVKFTDKGEVLVRAGLSATELGLSERLRQLLILSPVRKDEDSIQLLYFVVRDTGIGIPHKAISKLFQEFSQASAGTSRKYGGTGLGLAICKKLVEAMGGKIAVDSEQGKGSDFAFVIPFQTTVRAEESNQTTSVPGQSEAEQRALRILVAEDNQPNQFLIRAILKKLGHQVEIVGDGRQAVDKVIESRQQDNYFDMVLMDLAMPEMDGFQATKEIRTLEADGVYTASGKLLPVIALTANALDEQKEAIEEAKIDDFLSKPIDIQKLKKALYRWSFFNRP